MSKGKSKAPAISEEEYQRKHDRWCIIAAGVISCCKLVIICVLIFGCFYAAFVMPIQIAHGETTTIAVAQSWVVNVDAQIWVSWGLAATAGAWGWTERKLRHKERAVKDGRIAQLEQAIDPNRTSSNVDQKGNPKPGKKP
jgi:hypothetical protein